MIVVFGSVNADFVFEVERLPRPGETVLCPGYRVGPGGKGSNQAAAAARAGARVALVGHLGDDAHAAFVRGELEAAGVDCGRLAVSKDRPTAVAFIGVDAAGENAIVVASGANLDTHPGQLDDAGPTPADWLLCQNEIRQDATFEAIRRAKAAGARTALNLAPAGPVPADVLDALDLLVVNELEAEAAAGGLGGDPVDLARRLATAHGLACVVTLGGRGSVAASGGETLRVAALPVRPVDTTGAGDAYVGALVAALDAGRPLADALARASVGAALACLKPGAQTAPAAAEIEARLKELPAPG